jgi:hypothetical protein
MAAYAPHSIRFEPDEVERLERAELILLGVQPSEVDRMTPDERWDVLEIYLAQQKLRNRRRK